MSIVRHKIEHDRLGIPKAFAVLDVSPDTAAIYYSPIAGEPSASSYNISGLFPVITFFTQPGAGIVTELRMVTQGNAGGGANVNVRWSICSIRKASARQSGFTVDAILAANVVAVADNFNGEVVLATGLNLVVPAQFVVLIQATNGTTLQVRHMNSAGPIPGVQGALAGISTATYIYGIVSSADPPDVPATGGDVYAGTIKGCDVYVKWKGQ